MKKTLTLVLLALLLSIPSHAQMLFTENLTLSIDSTKTIQGSLLPVVDFKTEQQNILTVKNTANLNLLIKHKRVEFKVSTGLQSRYRLVNKERFLMFAAAGVFYEFEKWKDPTSSAPTLYACSRSIKTHLALSFQHNISDHWSLTATAIHQGKPDSYFKKARFGGAVDLLYKITPAIGINGAYRLIYDTAPIVPIRKSYTSVEAGLAINF